MTTPTSCARSSATCVRKYGAEYRVIGSDSPEGALDLLKQLKVRNDSVALLLADQRMPHMDGVAFLQEAMQIFPEAKRALLTAYADTNAAISAINQANINYFFMKPWDPPAEHLYPQLDDLLDDWQASYRPAFEGIRVLGTRWSPRRTNCAIFWRAITFPISGSTWSFPPTIRKPSVCWKRWGRMLQVFPSCSFRTARNFSRASRRKSRKKSDCGRARKPAFTTWRLSAEGRRAWLPPCTARRRVCTR